MGYLKRKIIEAMEPTEHELARRWIPVEERLPEEGEMVWCYGPKRGCEAARVSKKWGWIGTDKKNLIPTAYTHWMPLPEPPEVK